MFIKRVSLKDTVVSKCETGRSRNTFSKLHVLNLDLCITKEYDYIVRFDATIIIRLSVGERKKLERIAKQKGLSISALARMWLMEKANETLKMAAN